MIQPQTRLSSDDFYIANLCVGTRHIEHIGGVYMVIYGKLGKIDVGLMLWTLMGYDPAQN